MEFIIHRINKINELKKIPKNYGTEIDIRCKGSKLILNHEPHENGDRLLKIEAIHRPIFEVILDKSFPSNIACFEK